MAKQDSLDPYEMLAHEIIMTAVKDYRTATRKLSRRRKSNEAELMKEECLRFFRSPWFATLTSIAPEFLIKKLDQEVE